MPVSVCIPTVGRIETLPTVLFSLLGQADIAEVILLDEAKVPVCEAFAVNQMLDLLSLHGIQVKVLRSRTRSGIGAARRDLILEAKNETVLMVDDDVVLGGGCVETLQGVLGDSWAVPTCLLVSAGIAAESDGYIDRVVSHLDPAVTKWTKKYPWFIPYFRYSEKVSAVLKCAGTQCILGMRSSFVAAGNYLTAMRSLPREDTVLTTVSGPGSFISTAECYHFEHRTQLTRGEWSSSMFYRVHEAIMADVDQFMRTIGYADENFTDNG